MIMGIDLGAITDPQFRAELDFAAKQYAARAVGKLLAEQPELAASELHQLLLEQALQAGRASNASE